MAGGLKLLLQLLCAVALAGAANFGFAQNVSSSSAVSDPTRPPATLISPDGAASADGKPATPLSGFQAVVLRKGIRTAVINGATVPLGGKLGEARLVSLSESEAVLEGPEGREVLRMTPNIEKKIKKKPKITAKRSGGRAKHGPTIIKSNLTK